eukprot:4111580-Pleurochrysis_carterae.AAC.1
MTGMHSDIRCWRNTWDILRDPIGCMRSAAMFYVMPVATMMETMLYMGLRAILRLSSTEDSRLCKCE